jgi:hypothetical protein
VPMGRKSRCFVVSALLLSAGCLGSSKPAMCPAGPLAAKACPAAMRPADDGMFDDFEDGATQVPKTAERGGYWFESHDPNGSTIDPSPLSISQPGAGSEKALHIFGQTANADGAWGSLVGANFVETGVYDASKYAGISFKAKVGPTSTKSVRFNVGDVNTHPDGGVCKSCWNHFGKDLQLTSEWKEYTVSFAELQQQPGWGDQFPAITPSKLMAIYWAIGPGKPFDLWVDDIRLLECN